MKAAEQPSPVEVDTRNGRVRGLEYAAGNQFKGIRYAAPVEGLNRWLPPKLPQAFQGTFDATAFGPAVPQAVSTAPGWMLPKASRELTKQMDLGPQGADSLRLNVYTPSLHSPGNFPVIVFCHGGGLSMGAASQAAFDAAALASKGVVVVTMNYRLSTIGFLAGDGLFGDEVCVGNRGFMDQVAVLEWVRDNIAGFGGDPGNVTISGHSAGGTSVWAMLSSPRTEGLFHRAIAMSGPINMMPIEDHLKLTRDVLKALNVSPGDAEALGRVPNSKVTGLLVQKMVYRRGTPYGEMSSTRFPAAGAYHTDFMPDDVPDAMANARLRNIDLMVGSSRHDGRVSAIMLPVAKTLGIRMMNTMLAGMIGATRAERKMIVAKYRAAMPGASSYLIHEQIQTDALYRMRALRAAEVHARESQGKTFMYQFNWESPAFGGVYGTMHGFDLAFAFNNLSNAPQLYGDMDAAQPLATAMSDAWVSFARSGTPASALLPQWPQYDGRDRQTMVFDRDSRVIADPDSHLRKIWAS